MPRSRIRYSSLLAVAALGVAAAGCVPGEGRTAQQVQAATSDTGARGQGTGTAAASAIVQLTPSQKRSAIATSFPAEVPVPEGRFTRGGAQGDAWDYDVIVEATPDEVAAWYRTQYQIREWVLLKEGYFDGPEGGGTFFDFRKNRAESSVSVYGNAGVSGTRVRVVVGVGTPVLQSQ